MEKLMPSIIWAVIVRAQYAHLPYHLQSFFLKGGVVYDEDLKHYSECRRFLDLTDHILTELDVQYDLS